MLNSTTSEYWTRSAVHGSHTRLPRLHRRPTDLCRILQARADPAQSDRLNAEDEAPNPPADCPTPGTQRRTRIELEPAGTETLPSAQDPGSRDHGDVGH
jgi:hypothetical protein